MGINRFFHPFQVFIRNPVLLIIWLVFCLFVANLPIFGIFFSGIKDLGFISSVKLNLYMGNYYTFSIAFLAVGIFDFFRAVINREMELRFKNLKVLCLALSVLLIILISFLSATLTVPYDKPIKDFISAISWTNIIFPLILYILSMILGAYTFCVSAMDNDDDYDNYKHLDDGNLFNLGKKVKSSKEEVAFGLGGEKLQ